MKSHDAELFLVVTLLTAVSVDNTDASSNSRHDAWEWNPFDPFEASSSILSHNNHPDFHIDHSSYSSSDFHAHSQSNRIDFKPDSILDTSYDALGQHSQSSQGIKNNAISPTWLDQVPNRDKKRVIRTLANFWYGSQSKAVKAYTLNHIVHKLTPMDFDTILQRYKDSCVLYEITTKLKQKYQDDFNPTHVDFDDDNIAMVKENPDTLLDHKKIPQWYTEESRKHKMNVIGKMSQLWYGDRKDKHRVLARYLVMKYFTQRDFLYVLQSKCSLDDPIIHELKSRAAGAKGQACKQVLESGSKNPNDFDDIEEYRENNREPPHWYKDLMPELKRYVITRMCFMWYKDIEDLALRRRAQSNIVRRFTIDDFNVAADPATPYETMLEIARRTKGKEYTDRDREIQRMKRKICETGCMSKKTVERYVKDILGGDEGSDMDIDELENRIVEKWSGFPTLDAWLISGKAYNTQ